MEFKIQSKKYGEKIILISDCDIDLFLKYKIRVCKSGNTFYVRCRIKSKEIGQLHSIILQNQMIDHINGNGLDNRRENLRICNAFQNTKNAAKRKDYKDSIYKGVKKFKNKWIARIQSNKIRITIGYFDTEIDAAHAYDLKAKELHGEFARLNFV